MRSHQASPSASKERGRNTQSGMVGGMEVLPFGVLIFVAGALLLTNVWAVIDTKMATSAAAREGTRSYVESPNRISGEAAARAASAQLMSGYGKKPEEVEVIVKGSASFQRCDRVSVVVRYKIPAFVLPFGIGLGHGTTVSSQHSEIIDPLRSGLGKTNSCGF